MKTILNLRNKQYGWWFSTITQLKINQMTNFPTLIFFFLFVFFCQLFLFQILLMWSKNVFQKKKFRQYEWGGKR